MAKYPLPADGVKNGRFSPEGQPAPRHMPQNRKHGSQQEEQRLRAMGPDVAAYVDYVSKTPGIQRHRFLRELFALSQKVTQAVFVEAVARALRYRIVHLATLETTMDEPVQKILKYLRLWGLLAHWDELLAEATRGRFSHERFLKHVLDAE